MHVMSHGSGQGVQEWRVLLVDRDACLTTVLEMPLRKAGFSVSTAGTAGEAAYLFQQSTPNAVVLDPFLPDSKANELFPKLGRALQAGPTRPVLVLMSSLDDQDTTRRSGLTGDRFLAKPFDPWDLVRTLNELLESTWATWQDERPSRTHSPGRAHSRRKKPCCDS